MFCEIVIPLLQKLIEAVGHIPETITDCTKDTCCSVCRETVIPCISHEDADGDGYCDTCGRVECECDCICHKYENVNPIIKPFCKFFAKIVLFFWKTAGNPEKQYCSCGKAHW